MQKLFIHLEKRDNMGDTSLFEVCEQYQNDNQNRVKFQEFEDALKEIGFEIDPKDRSYLMDEYGVLDQYEINEEDINVLQM